LAIGISIRPLARPEARIWHYLGLILVLQAGLTFLDATPRYLMGDSGSYLWSVFHDGPYDRSWTYPAWFLRPILLFRSLNLVVYVQFALGVVPAWLAFGLVSRRDKGRSDVVAFLTACVCLIEPLALNYQRFFLADSLGLVMTSAAVFLCVRVIDRSAGSPVYAALAPPFMVLAASLRSSQIPSLALLCALALILILFVYRDYRSGAAMLASLVLCQIIFSQYAIKNQGTPGYNAASGRFLLAAVLPIVSGADVEPYIDPARTPAILDDEARDRRERPDELFKPGLTTDQIQQATENGRRAAENVKRESRLAGRIATHAILRDPIGFLGLGWSSYLDYFDEPFMRGRVRFESARRDFDANDLSNLAEHQLHGTVDTAEVQSPVRSYFEAVWRYYGFIPAISVILLAASLIIDRRLSTLTLAAFGLASAASHIALSTEPVPRYLIVAAWVNIVVAGRIASSSLPRRQIELSTKAESGIAWVNARSFESLDRPFVWWLFFAIVFAIIASSLTTDGTYDLANYHLYNGFAFFHDRRALDIFAAQLQTTFFCGPDIIYYSIFSSLNDWPVLINILFSIPYSLAALAIFLIARQFAKPGFLWPVLISAAATVFGLTGAANLATLGTTESDLVPGLAVLIALAIWLTLEKVQRNTVWSALGIGSLAGVSVSLKLTQTPLFIGMFVAVAVRFAIGKGSALLEAFAFGVGGLIAFAAIDGAWLWGNFTAYGNPIFPFMNNVFHSDLIAPEPWADLRFLPKTTPMALFYPAYWAFRPSSDVSELSMRDPRMLLGCVSALIVVLGFAWRWLRNRTAPPIGSFQSLGFSLAIAFLVSYALWEKLWSIYRYLAIQESLSGVMVLAALPILFGARAKPWLMSGLFALVVISSMRTTEYPWWRRVPPGPQATSVRLPPLEQNAMVLFLDPQPYSFLVPSMPISARAIGVNNNLVHPGSSGRLWTIIEAAVRDHQGPLWGIEDPNNSPGLADASLGSLSLARDECAPLISNMEAGEHGKICKLRRTPAP
jgi:hypothetical protein